MLIIKDESMGQSWGFVEVKEGYAEAYLKIQEITGLGHRVGGDVARVMHFMGN